MEERHQRCDLLNVDDLLGKQTSQLKVVIVAPSVHVESHRSFDDKTKSVIVNLCRKNWKTVANSLFQQPRVREKLEQPLRRAVSADFKEYCSTQTDSVLKKSSPEDLASFSTKVLVHKAEVWCPLWMACLKGTFDVQDFSSEDIRLQILSPCRRQSLHGVEIRQCQQFCIIFPLFSSIAE